MVPLRHILLFLLLCQWLQQISRKANEGTYHYFSCSIAQSRVATGMEVVEDSHCPVVLSCLCRGKQRGGVLPRDPAAQGMAILFSMVEHAKHAYLY